MTFKKVRVTGQGLAYKLRKINAQKSIKKPQGKQSVALGQSQTNVILGLFLNICIIQVGYYFRHWTLLVI